MYGRKIEVGHMWDVILFIKTLLYSCDVNLFVASFTRRIFFIILTTIYVTGGMPWFAFFLNLLLVQHLPTFFALIFVCFWHGGYVDSVQRALTAFLLIGREDVEIRGSWIEFMHLPHHEHLKSKSWRVLPPMCS